MRKIIGLKNESFTLANSSQFVGVSSLEKISQVLILKRSKTKIEFENGCFNLICLINDHYYKHVLLFVLSLLNTTFTAYNMV